MTRLMSWSAQSWSGCAPSTRWVTGWVVCSLATTGNAVPTITSPLIHSCNNDLNNHLVVPTPVWNHQIPFQPAVPKRASSAGPTARHTTSSSPLGSGASGASAGAAGRGTSFAHDTATSWQAGRSPVTGPPASRPLDPKGVGHTAQASGRAAAAYEHPASTASQQLPSGRHGTEGSRRGPEPGAQPVFSPVAPSCATTTQAATR